jgi:ubiquinone/menaquinone biosynthesis C-methylase UbiE
MEAAFIFDKPVEVKGNLIVLPAAFVAVNQQQTNESFTGKWQMFEKENNTAAVEQMQKEWYLKLYGFDDESKLGVFLQDKKVILDAGCGTGFKSAWLASLSPSSLVIGMDSSESVLAAAKKYSQYKNLFFVQGDIAATAIKQQSVDYINCDQVIQHTENPETTFAHLSYLLKPGGQFACYVYAKKALPRELVDDYFRTATHTIPAAKMWEMSKQLTQLGKSLSELNVKFTSPDIPLLGIKGGEYDIQRFIYWNFLKCFWKEEWGEALSASTNFDWYAPSNAKRFTKEEFDNMGVINNLTAVYTHSEEACHTARFKK